MKKLGIVTVYGENNYGNKLQNYALVQIYTSLNFDCVTIRTLQSSMVLSKKDLLKKVIKKCLSFTKKYKYFDFIFKREQNFQDFSRKYLKISPKIYNTSNINHKFLESFDILSVGSDQVWNEADFNNRDIDYFTLANVQHPKKMSFAASLGKENFSDKNFKKFADNIKRFDLVSCREKTGTIYLEKILGIKCYNFIDPTLMLNAKEWSHLEKKPDWLDNRYNLLYFLGGYNHIDKINKYTNIDVLDKKTIAYTTTPEEFIYLIHNSEIIHTDSFHACVFAIIFRKKIIVYDRIAQYSDMSKRLKDLFHLFGKELEFNRLYDCSQWKNIDSIISEEKNKIYDLLKNIL